MSEIKVETDELIACAKQYKSLAEGFKTVADKTIEKCKSYGEFWKGSFADDLDEKVKKLKTVENTVYQNSLKIAEHIQNAVDLYIKVDNGLAEQSQIGTVDYPDNVQVSPGLSEYEFSLISKALKEYQNTPYVRGGSSKNGVDCSGLVMSVFRETGIKTDFPHSAKDIYADCKAVGMYSKDNVNLGELRNGDLVFYSDGGVDNIKHVGVYMGDGMVISALNEKDGVAIKSINYTSKKNIYVARVKK